jgi:hypothetical protein
MHTLTGWVRLQSGSATASASLEWFDDGDAQLNSNKVTLTLGASYTQFSVSSNAAPGAASLMVHIEVQTVSGVVCFDDFSLDGPAPATATPLPTDTPTPTLTATSTETPLPNATAQPTETPAPPTSTAAPGATATPTTVGTATVSATSSPKPGNTATAVPSATVSATPQPGLVFVNGGFDDGLYGWRKYGGDLSVTGGTGVLTSDTTSTKWAYETVAIDPAKYYEFEASLKPDAGVSSAFLRISWYASGDGSGSAVATADSTSAVSGPAATFEQVSTGPVQPPSNAFSARLRVMLAPAGSGAGNLYFDDVSFGVTAAPPPTPQPTASPTGTKKASATGTPTKTATTSPTPRNSATAKAVKTQQAAEASDDPESWDVSPVPGSAKNVSAAVKSVRQVEASAGASGELDQPVEGKGGSSVPVVWLIGAALLVVGLAGAFVQGRRRG